MRVLVTGSTGYVGSAIVAALERARHEVIAAVAPTKRGHAGLGVAGHRYVEVDIARPATLDPALPEVDAIVHAALASSAEAATIDRSFVAHVLARFSEGRRPRRFLYTSGVWVLGDTRGQLADETSTPLPPAVVGWRPEVESMVSDAHGRGRFAWIIRPGRSASRDRPTSSARSSASTATGSGSRSSGTSLATRATTG